MQDLCEITVQIRNETVGTRFDQDKKEKTKILRNTFCLIHCVDLDYEVHCTFAHDI